MTLQAWSPASEANNDKMARSLDVRIVPCPCPGGYGIKEFDCDEQGNLTPRPELTFPREPERDYYQPGDVILTAELNVTVAQRTFRELEGVLPGWQEQLAAAFGVKIGMGSLIKKIRLYGSFVDQGFADVTIVLILDAENMLGVIETDRTAAYKVGSLDTPHGERLASALIGYPGGSSIGPIAQFVADLSIGGVAGGARKAIGKRIVVHVAETAFAKYLAKRAILQLLVVTIPKSIAKGAIAFAQAAVPELLTEDIKRRVLVRNRMDPFSAKDIRDKVLFAGVAAFVKSIVGDLIGADSRVNKWLAVKIHGPKGTDKLKDATLGQWLVKTLRVKLLEAPAGLINAFVDACNSAHKKASKGGGPWRQLVVEELPGKIVEPLRSGIKDFLAQPGTLSGELIAE